MRTSLSILFFVLLPSLIFCKKSDVSPSQKLIDLDVYTTKKEKFNLSEAKGKVVVLDFWATWCEPCSKAVPVINRWKSSVPEEDFLFLGVNTDTEASVQEIEKHSEKLDMKYKSVLDPDWKLTENYQVEGMPCLIVFGKDGRMLYRQYGLQSEDLAGLIVRSRVWND
ncbi:TlpA family protein disulfide reductase [Leptospira idonii]|uniref:TlpA family protein disulfide reductase n=1 Tax=Leptospira idonii TaxID=1193500 RepID=A0A4R9LZX4_9LEPT|nr:TlpA disulfide reductase family protein [Leptospira idonii]TGN18509.1 TlpA family protein disulfide reductase [Leptospira idonii]